MKCKNCGAELNESQAIDGVLECEYCFSRFTLPKKETAPAALEFLHIGEHDLDTGKFTEAFEAYRKAAELDVLEPEAHFGMALSEYGVQTIKDVVNNRLQSVCHQVSSRKFTENTHYLNALRLASAAQKKEYEKRAEEIDYINAEFFSLKESGLDYDCFLCVKVTGENGEKTEDSKDADYIYRLLQDKGYKPFYSEREIRNRVGRDYEAMILYALHTAETMLVVCRNGAYLQTPWVKNEYTRFLSLVNDEEKESDSVALVYYKEPIERLPGKNGKLQGIDFSLREADGQILSFVESHTPEARAKREKEAQNKSKEQEEILREIEELKRKSATAQTAGGVAVESYISRADMELYDGAYAKAKEFYEKAVELSPENGRAWFGIFLAVHGGKGEEEILQKQYSTQEIDGLLAENSLARAEKFGDPEWKEKVASFRSALTEKREARRKQEEYDDYIKKNFVIDEDGILEEYLGDSPDVVIPQGVKALCRPFRYKKTNEITSVAIPEGVGWLSNNAFKQCCGLKKIKLPDSLTRIGEDAFNGCTELVEVEMSDNVRTIEKGAFHWCKSLSKIRIPKGLKLIDQWAFSNCRIEEAIIPDGVTEIKYEAFYDCNHLQKVVIPDSVTSIGKGAFKGCWRLTEVTLPNGISEIAERTFCVCFDLVKITIPNTVRSIGVDAFSSCKALKEVVFQGTKAEWKKIKIYKGNKSLKKAKKIFNEE